MGMIPKINYILVLDKLDPALVVKLYGGEEVFLNPLIPRTAPKLQWQRN